ADLSRRLVQLAPSVAGLPASTGGPPAPPDATAVVAGLDVPTTVLASPAPSATTAPPPTPEPADRRRVAGTQPSAHPSRSRIPVTIVAVLVLATLVLGGLAVRRLGQQTDTIKRGPT